MVMVKCPICNENVTGEGENDLSFNLQEHLYVAHDFKTLCQLEDRSGLPSSKGCRPSVSDEEGDLPYGVRTEVEGHLPPEQRVPPGEDVEESVRCPVCGETLFGHAFDDLSYNLSDHMVRNHNLKRTVLGKG
jgi:hypothetical protein